MTTDELRNYKQIRTPDYAKLASLVTQAKGPDRTMAQFSEATGIGASTLSRLINLNIKKPLSMETLIKIYDNRANQEDEYLLERLANANGLFSPDYADRVLNHEHGTWRINGCRSRENLMKNAIIGSLVDCGYGVSLCNSPDAGTSLYPYRIGDFSIHVEDKGHTNTNQLWCFELDAHIADDYEQRHMDARHFMKFKWERRSGVFLMDAWEPEKLKGIKISYVFIDKGIFDAFCAAVAVASVHNEMSIILIDPTTYRVLDEVWIRGDYDSTVCVRYFDNVPSTMEADDYEENNDYYQEN